MKQKNTETANPVEMMPGITRRTLCYNDQAMLCVIEVNKNATIPLHNHEAVQIGMIQSGKVRFFGKTPEDEFIATTGDSYVMASNEPHGAEGLEDSVLIETFTPSRPEYADFDPLD